MLVDDVAVELTSVGRVRMLGSSRSCSPTSA
jgi:hypothetical protein